MTDEVLLPCPFCRSADVEVRESITDAMVACNNCGSRTGLVFLGASYEANVAKIREAVNIWNTRATTPASGDYAELVERLTSPPVFAEPADSQRLRLVAQEAATAIRALQARLAVVEGENVALREKLRLKIVPAEPIVFEDDAALSQKEG